MLEPSAPTAHQVSHPNATPAKAIYSEDSCPDALALEQARRELVIETIRRFGSARLQVAGTSMLPTIWPGDILAVEAAALEDIHLGDIVLVEHDGRLRIHRVLTVSSGSAGITTQGDSLPLPDAAVLAEQLVGRVVGKVSEKGTQDPPRWTRTRRMIGRTCAHSRWAALLLLRLAGRHKGRAEGPAG